MKKNKKSNNNKFSIVIILLIFIIVSSPAVFATSSFKKINSDYNITGNPVKLNDGKILFTGGIKNLIFDPKSDNFQEIEKPNSISLYKGVVLKDGKVLFVGAVTEYPIIAEIEKLFAADFEREEISKTVLERPVGVSIKDYRDQQKKAAWDKYLGLTYEEREKIFMPYLEKNPEILKKYNRMIDTYKNSMYGQLYDPVTNTWSRTGKINVRRKAHNLYLLNDGKVLIIGGITPRKENLKIGIDDKSMGERASKIEIYDPKSKSFELKDNTKEFGFFMLLDGTVLKDNRVFLLFRDGTYMFYDPQTNTYSEYKKIPYPIKKHIILSNKKLLIFSSPYRSALSETNIDKIILFDINKEEYKEYDALFAESRGGNSNFIFDVAELKDGNVLVIGGEKNIEKRKRIGDRIEATNSAEIINPMNGTSIKLLKMNYPRVNSYSIVLDDGRVLIFDRNNKPELYVP